MLEEMEIYNQMVASHALMHYGVLILQQKNTILFWVLNDVVCD